MQQYGVKAAFNLPTTIQTKRQKTIEKFKLARPDLAMCSDYSDSRTEIKWACVKCRTEFESSTFQTPTCPTCFTRRASKGQHEVNEFIRSLGIETRVNDRRMCGGKFELDIWVPSLNICFEYDGLYWHSEKARADIKIKSKEKYDYLKQLGIKQFNIFEDDWTNKRSLIESRISAALGKNIKVGARKTVIEQISNATAARFCDLHHLQGRGPANSSFGLFLNGELVSVMTFAKPRFNKNFDVELIRYCTKSGLTIVGGASKLWAKVKTVFSGKRVISYSDNRWGWGEVYAGLGFENAGQTGQGYFYVTSNSARISRSNAQKKKLPKLLVDFDNALSERDNCWNNKLYRVWDLGNTKWAMML